MKLLRGIFLRGEIDWRSNIETSRAEDWQQDCTCTDPAGWYGDPLVNGSLTSGIIGINIMVAASDFAGVVKTAIDEGIDLVVAGAGFSRDMFGLGKESGTPIVPIVSSVKLAKISERLGAAAIVLEGKEAGGHLGTNTSVRDLIPSVSAAVKIPVIAAGGVLHGQDIVDMIKMGAAGVQMGSRFAASVESNAAPALKEYYLKSKPEDIVVIHSPVGLPGRAVRTPFSARVMEGPVPPKTCDACLKACRHNFCIIRSLIRAQQGDVETGLVNFLSTLRIMLPLLSPSH